MTLGFLGRLGATGSCAFGAAPTASADPGRIRPARSVRGAGSAICLGRQRAAAARPLNYTLNRKVWNPDVDVPYVIAMVELAEQAGLRLTTNIVNCAAEDLSDRHAAAGAIQQQGEHYVPLFEPGTVGRTP